MQQGCCGSHRRIPGEADRLEKLDAPYARGDRSAALWAQGTKPGKVNWHHWHMVIQSQNGRSMFEFTQGIAGRTCAFRKQENVLALLQQPTCITQGIEATAPQNGKVT